MVRSSDTLELSQRQEHILEVSLPHLASKLNPLNKMIQRPELDRDSLRKISRIRGAEGLAMLLPLPKRQRQLVLQRYLTDKKQNTRLDKLLTRIQKSPHNPNLTEFLQRAFPSVAGKDGVGNDPPHFPPDEVSLFRVAKRAPKAAGGGIHAPDDKKGWEERQFYRAYRSQNAIRNSGTLPVSREASEIKH